MRVCDNALEAIMRLEQMDMIKVYKKEKRGNRFSAR